MIPESKSKSNSFLATRARSHKENQILYTNDQRLNRATDYTDFTDFHNIPYKKYDKRIIATEVSEDTETIINRFVGWRLAPPLLFFLSLRGPQGRGNLQYNYFKHGLTPINTEKSESFLAND